jgi:hypothetical protein
MSDFDLDNLLAGAVADYHDHTLPQIKPAGTAAARATATHRKRVHAAAMSLAALVVVAVPIAGYAATQHNHNGPPTGVGASSTASPEATPSATPSAPASPTHTRAPVTQQDLANATLDLPSWGEERSFCPHGRVTLHNGDIAWTWPAGYQGGMANLRKAATVDVDGDGSADAVGVFFCGISDPGSELAVAFRRAADGSITTMGTVGADVDQITDVRAGANSTVDLRVSDLNGSDDVAHIQQVVQWRTYRWTGTGFAQTAGPTAFTVSRPEVTATISDLTFDPAAGGKRVGTLTVSVHNGGSTALADVSVVYEFGIGTVTSPACDKLEWIDIGGQCRIQSIAPGATGTLTFKVSADDATIAGYKGMNVDQIGGLLVQIRVGGLALTNQPKLGRLVIR